MPTHGRGADLRFERFKIAADFLPALSRYVIAQ